MPPVLPDIYHQNSLDAPHALPRLLIDKRVTARSKCIFSAGFSKPPLCPWQPWTRYHTGHPYPFNGSWLDRQKFSSKIAYVCSLSPCFDACGHLKKSCC